MEQHLRDVYEQVVARLVAHVALHTPHFHQADLREVLLRGERELCERCGEIRTALVEAAKEWRAALHAETSAARRASAEHSMSVHLGLAG